MIKMTELEKKAKESWWSNQNVSGGLPTYDIYKEGYIAGAKENGVIWHDLRKNPNDLPQKVGDYIVALDYQTETFSTSLLKYDIYEDEDEDEDDIKLCWFDSEYNKFDNVIAWCEIPKYMEE